MSGIFHAIGKVFSDIVSVVRKIWKPVLIAVAVYFTAGMALAYMPATAGIAAEMPGIASAVGEGGSLTGAGVFSTMAANMGAATAGGTLDAAGAAAAADASGEAMAGDIGTTAGTTAGTADASSIAASDAAGVGAAAAPTAAAAAPAAAGYGQAMGAAAATASPTDTAALIGAEGGTVAPASSGILGSIASGVGKMSFSDKLLALAAGSSAISGLTSPSPSDLNRINKTWVGAYWGVNGGGSGAEPAAPMNPDALTSSPAPPANWPGSTSPSSQAMGAAMPTASPNPYAPSSAVDSGSNPYNSGESYISGIGYMSPTPGNTLIPGLGSFPGSSAAPNPAIVEAQTSAKAPADSYNTPYSPAPTPGNAALSPLIPM